MVERSVKFTDGTGILEHSGRVDTEYRVDYNMLFDNETISLKCSKDGEVTGYGENESI